MTTRVALVTGGTGGIGTAICRHLAQLGHKVATNYRDEAKAKAWQDAQRKDGFEFALAKGDVADAATAEAMVREVEKQLGPVDILINNAGITRDTTFHKMNALQWQEVIATNLGSCFNVTRPVIDGMRERKWGRILTVASTGVVQPIPNLVISNALRSSIVGWSKTLSGEVAKEGITVNVVLPGRIKTDRTTEIDSAAAKTQGKSVADVEAASLATIPMARYGKVEEFADVVCFLASERASYVTGSLVRVDGGAVRSV